MTYLSEFNPVRIKRLDKDLPLPARAHRGDAGADLYSTEDLTLAPGERRLVGTGVALALPLGTRLSLGPREGHLHRFDANDAPIR